MLKQYYLWMLLLLLSVSMTVQGSPVNDLQDINHTLNQVYQKYKNTNEGQVADYIPELAKVNPGLFAIVVITAHGQVYSIGDANMPFAIESVSKPFVYALALQDNGAKTLADKVGLNATGHSFNSILAIEENKDHLQNPLVNAGAIQINSYIKGKTSEEKWQRVLALIQQASDGKPYLSEKIYHSEMSTNQRNRAIAELLTNYGMLNGDTNDAVDRYTKACSIMVSARQLALMGATLANQGVNPLTHTRVFSVQTVRDVLSQMLVNGMYENSGMWLWHVGIPAKSGVSGAILAVVPNKMAIVVFSPRLDKAGNSVKGQLVIKELAERWKLHILSD